MLEGEVEAEQLETSFLDDPEEDLSLATMFRHQTKLRDEGTYEGSSFDRLISKPRPQGSFQV